MRLVLHLEVFLLLGEGFDATYVVDLHMCHKLNLLSRPNVRE